LIHNKETIGAEVLRAANGGFVYLASPYSKLAATVGLDEATRVVAMAAGSLMSEGCVVFSPIVHGHHVSEAYGLDKLDQEFWMGKCYPIASKAAVCVVLKFEGWRESEGVKAEVEFFKSLGVPVIYVEPHELIPYEKYFVSA
jgi:hypothetical protein